MIIELHAIQSFAPANLNRDDQGAPKSCTFGGVPRARVSSQSWKRAMRVAFFDDPAIETAVRTKRAHEEIVERVIAADPNLDTATANHRAAVLLESKPLGLSLKDDEETRIVKTGQLVFFRDSDLGTFARLALEHGEALDELPSTLASENPKKAALPNEVAKEVEQAMTSPGAALDVALFGRMVAEMPEGNVDAACQMAHAVGTHRVAYEADYYTAVDDLKPEDTEGADMIGEIQFNASCFYRYAAVDTRQLADNLGAAADAEHVAGALVAFARAFVTTVPTGKQTTFAARNLPAAVLAVRRERGAINLINAFVEPILPGGGGIVIRSIDAMLDEYSLVERMYSTPGTDAVLLSAAKREGDRWSSVEHLDDLVAHVSRV